MDVSVNLWVPQLRSIWAKSRTPTKTSCHPWAKIFILLWTNSVGLCLVLRDRIPTSWCRYDLGRQRSKRGVAEEKWMFKQLLDVLEKNRFSHLTCRFGCFSCCCICSDFIERVWSVTFLDEYIYLMMNGFTFWPYWGRQHDHGMSATFCGWDVLAPQLPWDPRRKHHFEATTATWPNTKPEQVAGEQPEGKLLVWDGIKYT